jgi:hypothetical protein
MHLLLPDWHDLHGSQKRRNIEIDVSIGGPRIGVVAAVPTRPKATVVYESLMQQDFYFALSSVIMSSARDNPELRSKIYNLARSKLRRQLDREAAQLGATEGTQQLQALEIAIKQIEADLARDISPHPYAGALVPTTSSKIEIIPPSPRPVYEPQNETVLLPPAPANSTAIWSVLPLIAAAILGVAAYLVVERGVYETPQAGAQADRAIAGDEKSAHPPSPALTLPTGYGVYALENGRLAELEPLPIRMPEREVAISGTLSTASKTTLPQGKIQFIAFRRDLVNKAPEKVPVRVVAQVKHRSARGRSEEVTTNDAILWVVRSVSYEMKVSPIGGNPAMIVIRPADVDFTFPAGRYALILKGVAYDFNVGGSITDLAQCVEQTEELNSPVYTQCRTP